MLKSYLVPAIASPSAGGKRDAEREHPAISLLSGKPGAIPVRLQNLYGSPLGGTLRLDLPAGWMREPESELLAQARRAENPGGAGDRARGDALAKLLAPAHGDVRPATAPGRDQALRPSR